MRLIVDAATGLVREQRFGEVSIARWTRFVTDEPADPTLFRWGGPSTTRSDIRQCTRTPPSHFVGVTGALPDRPRARVWQQPEDTEGLEPTGA
jgi:hypothetical protein